MPTGSSTEVSDSARRVSRAASGLITGVNAPFAGHPGVDHAIVGIGGYPPSGARGAGCCSGIRQVCWSAALRHRASAKPVRTHPGGRGRIDAVTSPLDWIRDAAATREGAGLTRRLSTTKTGDGLDLAGNDYLGLRTHPAVIAGAVAAAETYGGGAGASRLVTGTLDVHDELEAALAALTGAPSALALSSGYAANLAVLTTLADAGTLVVSDEHAHASLIDGCRLSRAAVTVARHNDLEHVAELLSRRDVPRAVVVVESIYSVLGDAAPIEDLVALTAEAGAILVVDEAHALGVVGPHGGGLVAAAGQAQAEHVVVTATLSNPLRHREVRCSQPPSFASTSSTPPAPSSTTPGSPPHRPAPPWPPSACCATTLTHRPGARQRRPAGRGLRRRGTRRRRDVGADAGAARSGRGGRAGADARHPDRLLPAPVDP